MHINNFLFPLVFVLSCLAGFYRLWFCLAPLSTAAAMIIISHCAIPPLLDVLSKVSSFFLPIGGFFFLFFLFRYEGYGTGDIACIQTVKQGSQTPAPWGVLCGPPGVPTLAYRLWRTPPRRLHLSPGRTTRSASPPLTVMVLPAFSGLHLARP